MAVATQSLACVWSYGTDLRGAKITINGDVGADIVSQLNASNRTEEEWRKVRDRHADEARGKGNVFSRNDYAVALMHLREASAAVPILLAIEQEHPGSYVTASNLGTAYELTGDDRQALRWIREAIRRNPWAHDGTEWLHVRILEAKIAMASDATWLSLHSILGVDFGSATVPRRPLATPRGNTGQPVPIDDLKYALWYQLDERYQFVRAPDPVVASLLFDWANLLVRTDALESAAALYKEAIRYGAPRKELATARLNRVTQMLRDYKR